MTTGTGKEEVDIEKLLDDLQTIVTDAEALLKATAHHAGEKVREARAKAEESVSAARERLDAVQQGAIHQAHDLLGQGEDYVRRNPWQAVGIAAGAGLLLGLLITLSRRSE